MDKRELIITALTQRISELVTEYEVKIIEMRADFTIEYQKLEERLGSGQDVVDLHQQNKTLSDRIDMLEEEIRHYKNMEGK